MVKSDYPGRRPGVAITRWVISKEDRRAIAAYLGERRPVSLRRARSFLEEVGTQGLEEVYAEQQIREQLKEQVDGT